MKKMVSKIFDEVDSVEKNICLVVSIRHLKVRFVISGIVFQKYLESCYVCCVIVGDQASNSESTPHQII